MADTFQLEIATPERLLVQAQVTEAQLPGREGYLGILPGHASLLTELKTGVLSYVAGGQKYYVVTNGGFAQVHGDKVRVLADTAEKAEEIDIKRAAAARERAQKRLTGEPVGVDFSRALSALLRAEARIEAAQHGSGRHH